jgi:hypothetical protein
MKYFLLFPLILVVCVCALGQGAPKTGPQFDVADFNRKFEVAQWLVEYDTVAWKTTDLLMEQPKEELARLGREWFCFQDKDNLWHAVYGKLANGKYEMMFHFIVDREGKIRRISDSPDPEFLNAYATSLATSHERVLKAIPADSPSLNQYIKRNSDRSFTVWLLPAFQRDGTAVYGGEFTYQVDPTGTKILNSESYFSSFRGFASKPPREIWLNYRDQEKPSLGAIFFVWYYKDYFTKIFIDNSHSTSTVVSDGEKGYVWLHIEKDDKPPASASR